MGIIVSIIVYIVVYIIVYIIIHIWISIYGYAYMDVHIWISIYGYHIWISIYGYPYMDVHITYMLFGHETSFILRYQHVDKMNRIRKQFSIEWYGQNKILYGSKHGLYRKNLCQTLFCHETSFILRYGHHPC